MGEVLHPLPRRGKVILLREDPSSEVHSRDSIKRERGKGSMCGECEESDDRLCTYVCVCVSVLFRC